MCEVPEPISNVPRSLALSLNPGNGIVEIDTSFRLFKETRKQVDEVFGQMRSGLMTIVDASDWFFPNKGKSRVEVHGLIYRKD